MVKFCENQYVYAHKWEDVTRASWCKYPNPNSPHVLSVDIIERKVDASTGVLHTTRLISMQSAVPSWAGRILGNSGDRAYVYETSEVDPVNQKMVLKSQNITMGNLLMVEETCTYTPNPQDPTQTVFRQECNITGVGISSLLKSTAETSMLDKFQASANKGREGLELVLLAFTGKGSIPSTL